MDINVFTGGNSHVKKYVFSDITSIYEAVLYRYPTYEKRTVICCSIQSGCPIGCTFCGTGKRFLKHLSSGEIEKQTTHILKENNINAKKINKFQIMFMSMGEPMLNWDHVQTAIKHLHLTYPNAQLLISTVGVNNPQVLSKIVEVSKHIPAVGIQFSIHEYNDIRRNKIIPFKGKLSLQQIARYGIRWNKETGRNPFLNYIVTPFNSNHEAAASLASVFDPSVFKITLSVLCETDKTQSPHIDKKLTLIASFKKLLHAYNYDIRVFNPAGQDDIGGGCGQLWFVQDRLNNTRTH